MTVSPADRAFPGPAEALANTAAAADNHLLRGASWAREALSRHAGGTARFECAPFACSLTVQDAGYVAPAAPDAAVSVTIRLTPGLMLRLAANDASAWRDIEAAGDTDFAATLDHLARHLRWDAEEDLSRLFGDITAHRMAESGRAWRRWGEQAFDNTGRAFAEYWTEERPLIAAGRDLEAFNRAVDQLRDDVARLEKRLERLASRSAVGKA